MITPEEFPYITSIHVNDCYAYQDFDIPLFDYKPFSHLILTGKNGSGKSTILFSSYFYILTDIQQNRHEGMRNATVEFMKNPHVLRNRAELILLYVQAEKNGKVSEVQTVVKDEELLQKVLLNDYGDISLFKQYFVNKKVEQAFYQLDGNHKRVEEVMQFFDKLDSIFRNTLDDQGLEIIFQREKFNFYLRLSDGREIDFNLLSAGFSATLSIVISLLMKTDIIRKQANDFSYNPCGIVLIDEPETHLHLQLQEQVLPLLTSLFPNIQFIAATHSPAVVASIKNATIFDLTTKEARTDEVVGRSYSDLMVTHFGLDNEYSNEADAIIKAVNETLNRFDHDSAQLHGVLQDIYTQHAKYMAPSLKVELELLIAKAESKHIAHQ